MNNNGFPPGGNAGYNNKRAYNRYILNLKARYCWEQTCTEVVIRDFCLGGMYLLHTASEEMSEQLMLGPSIGDVIAVRFSLPTSVDEEIELYARVVRSDLNSLGISFVQPNFILIEKVLNYALQNQEQQSAATLPGDKIGASGYSGLDRETLLKNVRTITLKPIRTVIDRFLKKQGDVLFDMAEQSTDISEQNAYFAAISTFSNQGGQFKNAFLKSMRGSVYSAPENIDQVASDEGRKLSSNELSLVDDDAIDDWIARSEIADKVESSHHEALVGIEQRLSILMGIKIVKQNNPIGPESFSRAFQEALQLLDMSKAAYLACCKIFRDVLREGLGGLYKSVNDYLIKNNILPELHYEIKVQQDTGKPAKRKKPKIDIDLDDADELVDIVETDDGHNIYDLISTLQTIKHENMVDSSSQRSSISADQLISKLSDLVHHGLPSLEKQPAQGDVESVSLQLLKQLEQGDSDVELGPREAAIMETTGSIYDALYKDDIITSGVKEWLSEVELPLLNEALKDESVLADKRHIARSFINQLAKLELYNDESRDYISNSVKRTIEVLLKEVSAQEGMNEQLMTTLLKKINALVNVQNKAFNDNLSESLELCDSKTVLPTLQLKLSPDELEAPQEQQLTEWRKRIRRMKVGDWILFDAGSQESSRLKLAWISDNYDQYVFINMLGLLEGAIGVDELSCLLSADAALFLEDVEEPAVDRAQYKMLQNMHSKLMHESAHDHLTGLLNRREFSKRLKAELMDNSDVSESNVLCLLDIDYFDVINSTFGYEAGDQLLAEIGEQMKGVFADFNMLGRVASNEFAVLLTDCSLQQALDIVEKQKVELAKYRFRYEESSTMVTLSAGLVAIDLEKTEIPRLLQTAEAASRLAKSKGVNGVHVVEMDDERIQAAREVMSWASKIDDSMEDGSLVLRYQPISPANDDASMAHHAEILLGVSDETGSLISPEPFILAAEKYRRMQDIDRWVVKNVFSFLNDNPHVVDEIGGVAVNLSGLSVNDENFMPFIMGQIASLKVSTEHITFEVTETAGIECLSSAADFINEVKKTGCTFSLDDFGTGMSTYSYLKSLPVDFIKIDGSFVRDIESNESDRAMVKSITEIGHFMGKKIIAECVEKKSTIELLRSLDVDYVQGYAIARPKPLKEVLH